MALLRHEARALLARLDAIQSLFFSETMVPAAAVSTATLEAIERQLLSGRSTLRDQLIRFIRWLDGSADVDQAQRQLVFLRLRFNAVLSQLDIFSDALTQRSEARTGVWLAGLDALACDALTLPGYLDPPPLICYLDRGAGAAIRRARTRLPGGGENPVAVIRVPRERMIGGAVASSLIHEVGHQGVALLRLQQTVRLALQSRTGQVWRYWERWINEILADLWSVSRISIGATLGLMAVVSLPRPFVFRIGLDDPHPFPWIRVRLGCAIGEGLYPHPQWQRLSDSWERLYPRAGLPHGQLELIDALLGSLPQLVDLLLEHRTEALRGNTVRTVLGSARVHASALRERGRAWLADPEALRSASPCHVFAVLAQARVDGRISPEKESQLIAALLRDWAMRRVLARSRPMGGRAVGF